MPPEPGATEMVLRPPRLGRVVGWSLVVFGAVFAASGFTQPDDRVTLILMMLAGLVFAGGGLSLATSKARVSAEGIRYRNGLFRTTLPAQEVVTFSVGPGSAGAPPPRIAYVVESEGGKRTRLIGVQRWDTVRARAEMTGEARRVSELLGVTPPKPS